MTGTSLDGLDLALVRILGHGRAMTAQLLDHRAAKLGTLAPRLRRLAAGQPAPALEYLAAARDLGLLHARAARRLLQRHPDARLDLVVLHGQTIWHAPSHHVSWQLINPWPVAQELDAPVCYDLRQADLAAGGHGAPLTPMSDWVMYRQAARSSLVVNLGGICNVTFLPPGKPDDLRAGDIAPCNLLIDGLVHRLFPQHACDRNGALSAPGHATDHVVRFLAGHPRLRRATLWPGSLGREDFTDAWLDQLVADIAPRLAPADLLASAIHAVADRIGAVARKHAPELVILAGGAARNRTLVRAIAGACPRSRVVLSDALGVPISAREAMGFAVLGALAQDGIPITLPHVTGSASHGRAGAWIVP